MFMLIERVSPSFNTFTQHRLKCRPHTHTGVICRGDVTSVQVEGALSHERSYEVGRLPQ